jgi:hypothetical protein
MSDQVLQQELQLKSLYAPKRKDVDELRKWLGGSKYGEGFLEGTIENVWDVGRDNKDFVTTTPSSGLAYQISRFCLYLAACWGARDTSKIRSLDGSSEGSLASGISVILSSTFPVLPIVVLYFVNSLLIRLIVILAFTAALSAILVFGVRLKPDQTLTITTAYVKSFLILCAIMTDEAPDLLRLPWFMWVVAAREALEFRLGRRL